MLKCWSGPRARSSYLGVVNSLISSILRRRPSPPPPPPPLSLSIPPPPSKPTHHYYEYLHGQHVSQPSYDRHESLSPYGFLTIRSTKPPKQRCLPGCGVLRCGVDRLTNVPRTRSTAPKYVVGIVSTPLLPPSLTSTLRTW